MSREWYATFLAEAPCPVCGGKRLNEQALAVRIGGKNIYEWTQMSVKQAIVFIHFFFSQLLNRLVNINFIIVTQCFKALPF